MPPQFRGLRAFCEAAQRGSFKAAADELCVTSSAVSHQIRALEANLGVSLFERKTRAIELTAIGTEYYRKVAPLLASIDAASNEIRRGEKKTQLRVQMPDFFASELFVPRMAEFSDCYPDIDLRIESLPPKISPEQASGDVVVMLTGKQTEFPSIRKLFPVRYVPACSAARHDQLTEQGYRALEQATLLVHKARPQAWELWSRASGRPELAPKQVIRLDSMYALARATEQGVGIGLIPMPVCASWFTRGALHRLFDSDLVTRDHYCVATGGNSRYPEATRLLWEWIVETFSQPNCRTIAGHG